MVCPKVSVALIKTTLCKFRYFKSLSKHKKEVTIKYLLLELLCRCFRNDLAGIFGDNITFLDVLAKKQAESGIGNA